MSSCQRTAIRILILTACVALSAATVSADTKYVSVPADTTLEAGQTYLVPIRVSELYTADNIQSYQASLHYPPDILVLDASWYISPFSGDTAYTATQGNVCTLTPNLFKPEQGLLNFAAAGSGNPITGEGTLFSVRFKVRDNAPDKATGTIYITNISASTEPPYVPGIAPFFPEHDPPIDTEYVPGVVRVRNASVPGPLYVNIPSDTTLATPEPFILPIRTPFAPPWEPVSGLSMRIEIPESIFETPTAQTVSVAAGKLLPEGTPSVSFPGDNHIDIAWSGSPFTGSGSLALLTLTPKKDLISVTNDSIRVHETGGQPLLTASASSMTPIAENGRITAEYPTGLPILVSVPRDDTLYTKALHQVPIRTEQVADWDAITAFRIRIQVPTSVFEQPDASTVSIAAGDLLSSGSPAVTFPGGEFVNLQWTGTAQPGSGTFAYLGLTPREDLASDVTDSLRVSTINEEQLLDAGGIGLAPVSTDGRVVARYPTDIDKQNDLPQEPELLAWPNPFNGRVTLRFSGVFNLAHGAVYDINGRLIRRWTVPENGVWHWDGTDESGRTVGSGVYIAVVNTSEVTKRVRLTFLK